ncbi:steroid receptor RNA activator 1-like [Babylonia areolata]|uniref:steroid receptor RNA activator 1-like n=1 Tax=Babylonia areolata TaxID=304850 RepID=UPI003FD02409
MAASRPGNTDRGWNDPPMFDYQGSVSAAHFGTSSPQHTKLNKRVAYPMSPSAGSAVPEGGTSPLLNPSEGPPRLPPIQILPPVSTTSTPTPLPLLVPTLSPTADSTQQPTLFSPTPPVSAASGSTGGASTKVKVKDLPDLLADLSLESEESLLPFVKDGLVSALDSVKESVQGRAMEDVRKKLGLMEECWSAGKISPPVKSQLGSLVAAVQKHEMEEAHELHLALMINHTAEVHQWLVAVKRIIQELRAKDTPPTTQCEETTTENAITDPCLNTLTPSVPLSDATDTPSHDASAPPPGGEQDRNSEELAADSS